MFDVQCAPSTPPGPCDVLDDGSTENAIGFGSPTGTDFMWIQRQADASHTSTVVSSISTAWGTLLFPGAGPAVGSTARIGIWEDTDNDGDPTTGLVLVAGFPINVTVVNVDNDVLDTYPVTPVVLTGTYFIGASSEGSFPSPLDTSTTSQGRSWFVGNPSGAMTINYSNLNAEPVPPTNNDNFIPGVWLLRAGCDSKGTVSSYCEGDGTHGTCPCGNGGPGRGCANSDHSGGALLVSTAGSTASISNDQLVFSSARDNPGPNGFHPSSLAILFQGGVLVNGVTYGGGFRCIGSPIKRLFQFHPANGFLLTAPSATSFPPTPQTVSGQSAFLGDVLTAGSIRGYQLAYRDPFSCTGPPNLFNITQGIRVVWAP
jgi:hypothetical protein